MTPPDLLVSGDERAPQRVPRFLRRLVVVVVVVALLAVLGGLLVRQDRAEEQRRRQRALAADVVSLALPPGRILGPSYPPRRPGVHVLVANDGPSTVRLLSASLAPAGWQVELPSRRVLPAGGSVVLELSPPVSCGAPGPRRLRLAALAASGRAVLVELDVVGHQMAYGGDLDTAVALTQQSCAAFVPPVGDGRTRPHRSEVARPSR